MRERDRAHLEDIRQHGLELLSYLEGVSRRAYLADRQLQLVAERLLEIIGEAAGALSEDVRSAIDYDWRGVRGLRNILAHQYGVVEPARVWGVLRNRVPALVDLVEGFLRGK